MPISVLIADDHHLIRQALRALLEKEGFTVVGEAANGQEALSLTTHLHPDVTILDVAMPVLNGIDAAREIQRACPKTKTVLLSMYTAGQYILDGLRAGAKGFILKTYAAEDLVRGVRKAAHGETYLSPEISKAVVDAYRNKSDIPEDPLSNRERQVLQMVAEGKSTKEAASALNITTKTAESHRARIMEKLEIHNVAGLVRYAVRRGLIQP